MRISATIEGPAQATRVQEIRRWVWPYDASYPVQLFGPSDGAEIIELPGRGEVLATANAEIIPISVLEKSAGSWKGKPVFCGHDWRIKHSDDRPGDYVGFIESAIYSPPGRVIGILRAVDDYWRVHLLRLRLERNLQSVCLSPAGECRVVESKGIIMTLEFITFVSVDVVPSSAAGGHFLPI